MRQTKSCGVLVVRGEPISEFLLLRHADRLDLPKGHVDAGETEMQCAMRELEEETGITAQDIQIDPRFRFELKYPVRYRKYGDEVFEKTLVIFLGRLACDVPMLLTEHVGFDWFPWRPPHRIQERTVDPLLAQLEEYLQK